MRLLRWPSWRSRRPPSVLSDKDYQRGQAAGGTSGDLDEMNLTSEQENALKEFRGRVEQKIPPVLDSDFELLKWLVARNFDLDKSEDMLLKSLKWRKENDIDTILSWDPCEVLLKYYPVGQSGYDAEGSPVWIIPAGSCDLRGLFYSCPKREYINYTVRLLEKTIQDMRNKSQALDVPIQKINTIFDLENFSLRQFMWRPAMESVLELVKIYEANYPELLKVAYVVNAPKLFMAFYAVIKPFLHEVTVKKIRIFGRTGWQEAVVEGGIPPDQLPVYWGGILRDPDGDEKCPSMITLGGEIPKSYYIKKQDSKEASRAHLKSMVLPKSGKEVFELEVKHPGTDLRWEFQSDDFDVGFGITRTLSTGEEEVLMPLQRVNCHLEPEEGSLICTDPGMYKFTFDNEYSYIRSKNLYYKLELFPPTEHTKF